MDTWYGQSRGNCAWIHPYYIISLHLHLALGSIAFPIYYIYIRVDKVYIHVARVLFSGRAWLITKAHSMVRVINVFRQLVQGRTSTPGKFEHRGHIDEAKMYCTINYGVANWRLDGLKCMYVESKWRADIYQVARSCKSWCWVGTGFRRWLDRSHSRCAIASFFSVRYRCVSRFTFHVEFWRAFLSFLSTIALHHTTVCTTLHWT